MMVCERFRDRLRALDTRLRGPEGPVFTLVAPLPTPTTEPFT